MRLISRINQWIKEGAIGGMILILRINQWLKEGAIGGFIILVPFAIIGGFVILVPFAILWWAGVYVWETLGHLVQPVAKFISVPYLSDALVIVIVTVLVIIVGHVTITVYGTFIHSLVERIALKVPFYETIREIIKQVFGGGISFKTVVSAKPWGPDGGIVVGFLSGSVIIDNNDGAGEEKYCVIYVPSAPNPSNGNLYTVKEIYVQILEGVSPTDASKSIMALGSGIPDLVLGRMQRF
jgi:uncharacterized membrane protein